MEAALDTVQGAADDPLVVAEKQAGQCHDPGHADEPLCDPRFRLGLPVARPGDHSGLDWHGPGNYQPGTERLGLPAAVSVARHALFTLTRDELAIKPRRWSPAFLHDQLVAVAASSGICAMAFRSLRGWRSTPGGAPGAPSHGAAAARGPGPVDRGTRVGTLCVDNLRIGGVQQGRPSRDGGGCSHGASSRGHSDGRCHVGHRAGAPGRVRLGQSWCRVGGAESMRLARQIVPSGGHRSSILRSMRRSWVLPSRRL